MTITNCENEEEEEEEEEEENVVSRCIRRIMELTNDATNNDEKDYRTTTIMRIRYGTTMQKAV
jgi:hypothetical protein